MITDWRRKIIFSLILQPLIGQLYSRSGPTPRQYIWNLMSFKKEEGEKKNRKRKKTQSWVGRKLSVERYDLEEVGEVRRG